MPPESDRYNDIATRALIITLKSPYGGKTSVEIAEKTGISVRQINRTYARAIERGFDPNRLPLVIKDAWLQDAPRSGRPTKQTESTKQQVIDKVRRDRYGREKSCADIAGELSQQGINCSAITVWRILKSLGMKKTKPTRKPGLTDDMQAQRLKWCLDHRHWGPEEWKNVIWSDETSVVLLHRRGGYRVWRTSGERFVRSCIRERWKGASEFMFWGCFSYDKKGPCYSWGPETKKEKEEAEKKISELNTTLEPLRREEWELTSAMGRTGLRNRPGKTPIWKWNEQNGKLVRKGTKGGVDWWRYQAKILIPRLIPFAQECQKDRSETFVQEDRAPAHKHYDQQRVYSLYQVQRLLWCSNSPDLNMIEPCWFWMKRETTKKGAPKNRKAAMKAWEECWENLPQEKIQAWIERIPDHIEQVIALQGGNNYKEGRRGKWQRIEEEGNRVSPL